MNSGLQLDAGEDLVRSVFSIIELTSQSSGSPASFAYRNGVQKDTKASFSVGGTREIGAEAGAGRILDGDIAEVIVYNRVLTTAERQCIEDYLGAKYNIAVTH